MIKSKNRPGLIIDLLGTDFIIFKNLDKYDDLVKSLTYNQYHKSYTTKLDEPGILLCVGKERYMTKRIREIYRKYEKYINYHYEKP